MEKIVYVPRDRIVEKKVQVPVRMCVLHVSHNVIPSRYILL